MGNDKNAKYPQPFVLISPLDIKKEKRMFSVVYK